MTNLAAQIKKELKTAFPSIRFSAKTNAGTDIAIYIKYTNGPAAALVETITKRHESVSRCAHNQGILGGANTFVFVERIIEKVAI